MASSVDPRQAIHVKLKQDIYNDFDFESEEYENFVQYIMSLSGVGKGVLKRRRNLHAKFEALENKRLLGINNYAFLKKIATDSENIWVLELIEQAEEKLLLLDNPTTQTDIATTAVQRGGKHHRKRGGKHHRKTENKIQINNASEESIREIPGLDQQSAQQILLFRKENGNVTPELLLLINSKLTKEDLERIDFARNNQKFTANQEKHLGKDDTTCGGSEKADTALGGNEEDKDGTPLGGSEEGKDGTTLRGREEGKDGTTLRGREEGKDGTTLRGREEGKDGTTLRGREEGKDGTALGGSEEGKDDYTFPKEDTDQNKNKIRINFADVKSIMMIPGLDQNWAEKILLFRTGHGHVTQELLSYIQPTLSKEEMAKIDFTPYTYRCTDYQEDHVKDEMTHECTAEDECGICLKKGGKIPPYKTFLRTVDKLSTQTDKLRDFCRIVSNNLKKTIPNAKIVYSARNPKNDDIAFVVLSTNPSDQKYIGGYPVKMKYAYGHCNEDFTIRNMERKKDLCFNSTEEEKEINAAVRSAHDLFSKWPNYSRTSFSFYKSSRFNEKHSTITLIEKGCIVLFVFLKHWIPVGWGSFPDHFRGYEIDVRQSMLVKKHTFAMPSGHAFIQRGTIQGNIKHVGNNKMFALTAAHILLEEDEVEKRRENLQFYTEDDLGDVVLPVDNSRPDLHCVSVTKAALGGSPYVDAALLELSEPLQRHNIEFDWTEHGFTRQPTLTPSSFQPRKPAFKDIVIKYGITTGITIGIVRSIDASFENNLTGFIEIQPWQSPGPADSGSPASVPGTSGLPFSQPGDSGSLVFVVNNDIIRSPPRRGSNFESDLSIVGMVNCGLDVGLFYATHIDATMAALGSEYTFDE